jgi:hypothetical protein
MSTPPPFLFGQQDAGSGANDFNAFVFAWKRLLGKIRTIDMVQVQSCSNAGGVSPVGVVSVQVLTNQMTGNRNAVPHGTIYNVPYMRLQGGANAIILDPQVGDLGVCGFCSRDISAVKSGKAAANPGSYRMFDWADGVYFGGFLNGTPTQYIQFSATGVAIQAPAVPVSGKLGWNGATPPSQVTGFGTPSGGAVINSFPGGSASLTQTSETVAEILTIMKAHGMIGA